MKIGFIGLGNMATAIIGGLLREDTTLSSEDGNVTVITAANIIGSAKTEATRQKRAEQFGIAITASNREVAEAADVLVLAVKPQFFPEVIAEIRDAVSANTLVISIAAGLTLERIAGLFDRNVTAMRLIRCMPNTPALINAGCTAVVPGPGATEADEALCLRLMESFGRAIVIPERLMDAASATAGSSPAFVFMFIEALADGGVKVGLPRGQAMTYAAQMVLGAAAMVLESGKHPGQLKDEVCSPGGSTIAGVAALEERGFRSAAIQAVEAAFRRNQELGKV